MDWFNEGKEMAELYVSQMEDWDDGAPSLEPTEAECPWPIYTPEGSELMKGWNSVANENDGRIVVHRPQGHGWTFEPVEA